VQPLQFLERSLGSYALSRHEALFHCPFCKHHKPKLSINVESYCWKCWVCDERGRGLFSLVWRLQDRRLLADFKAAFPRQLQPQLEKVDAAFVLELPEEYVPLCLDSTSFHARRALHYLYRRSITDEMILRHKIGYASHGRFRDRIILPSFDESGGLNFFTGRTFVNDPFKYLNPSAPKGYKNTIIFNELNVDWQKPVFLVEGFMDMLRVGDNAIPLFGSTLMEESKLFVNLVIHEPTVYVCLDSDARSKQLSILESLIGYGVCCYDLNVAPYKDVAEMPPEAFSERRQRAQLMDKFTVLRDRIRNS
jgi:DNA primase